MGKMKRMMNGSRSHSRYCKVKFRHTFESDDILLKLVLPLGQTHRQRWRCELGSHGSIETFNNSTVGFCQWRRLVACHKRDIRGETGRMEPFRGESERNGAERGEKVCADRREQTEKETLAADAGKENRQCSRTHSSFGRSFVITSVEKYDCLITSR